MQSETLDLDLVVPVFNEERTLVVSIERLHDYLTRSLDRGWRITIADNASTDATPALADALAARLSGVVAVHLPVKGRGYALRAVWSASAARVVAYVDVDLSTDLAALPPLLAPLFSGHSDLAIGTRLSRGARVIRGTKREFISRSYNLLLRATLSVTFTDAQCGFKAMRGDVADRLLPLVEDDRWFFDTELLVLAERAGLRVHEVPVDWTDDPDSRVHIASTALDDMRGMVRVGVALARGRVPIEAVYRELGRGPLPGAPRPGLASQVVRFSVVGGFSTLAFALLYLLALPFVGPQIANFVALLITAIANTWANRWFTFGLTGREHLVRHHLQALVVFALAWTLTAGSLAALHAAAPGAGPVAEILVLTVANLTATTLRFALLRAWVFRARRASRRRVLQGVTAAVGVAEESP